jgi:predicted DNA-binding transcriptional regulator AlpA
MTKVLTDICDRLEVLEAAVFGRGGGGTRGSGDRRLTKPEVAVRNGVSGRTVDRWVTDGILPPPEIINGRWTWWLSALQRHERKRLREGLATQRVPASRFAAPGELQDR